MKKVPKYRKHSTRNLGFIEIAGKRTYLPGAYNSHESLSAYADVIKRLAIVGKPQTDIRITRGDNVPIRFLVAKFLDWAFENYRKKSGRQTSTYKCFKNDVVPLLLAKYEGLPTDSFGPVDLRELRNDFVQKGLSRSTINMYITKVKRIFAWGAGNELVPESVAGALKYVEQLEQGKTNAPETEPVVSVPKNAIDKTLPFLPPAIADMVLLQYEIGCRPSEVCNIRWCDIDQSDDIWIYEPFEHKTERKGKRRLIAIRKTGQTILEKYRSKPESDFIFSSPNSKKRQKKGKRYNNQYSVSGYESAIRRAALKAGVPHWTPNQIRHRFATDVDDTAQILLGHTNKKVTNRYIDHDKEKVKQAARRLDN
ncbi:MAG: site-specific integrase [Planctomycetaceae bacterium]|jgi:integrase|nr:site-specific integrase [Planctomycetaceae bacterium]